MTLWSGRVGGSLDPAVWELLRANDAEAATTATAKARRTDSQSNPASIASTGSDPSSNAVSYQAASSPRV